MLVLMSPYRDTVNFLKMVYFLALHGLNYRIKLGVKW